MYLKSIKNFFQNKFSIAGQLTFFYSVLSIVIFTIIAATFYAGMVEVLNKADRQYILEEIHVIKNILINKPYNLAALRQEVTELPLSLTDFAYHCYIRILNQDGTVLMETQDMSILTTGAPFSHGNAEIADLAWRSTGHHWYSLTQTTVNNTHQSWLVQIALDTTYQHTMMNTYRYFVLIILIIGILFSIAIGSVISKKAMKRLHEMTETTKKITVSSLQQRVNPDFWPNELSELGKAFNKMLDRIEEAFSRLIEFSDDLAHELRMPITNLIGETEVALYRANLPDEQRKVLESNLEELARINQIIENILFLARAENPQLEIKKEFLEANQEIAVVMQFYQLMAEEKNIQLTCTGSAKIYANSTLFRRMISNILSNAIKYAFSNTKIQFTVDDVNEEVTRIVLQDNGIGIDESHLGKVFDRFYRVDSARVREGGIGLGLSIVKSIIELHHGSIWIESIPHQGTTVIIHMPK